jgi:Polyketide cyclase / dehydrase and lipid transport
MRSPLRHAASTPQIAVRFSTGMGIRAACLLLAALMPGGAAFAADDDWKVATKASDVVVYERTRKGSKLREFKAVGVIESAPAVVKRVIEDVDEYPAFMPYVAEATVISRDGPNHVSYQRLSPPLISDLDYTVRVTAEKKSTPAGTSYLNSWVAANDQGPAEKRGVTRVKITEGSWLLEPEDGGKKTRATYCAFSDSASSMPTAITNAASRSAIPKLFRSVAIQAQLPKYRQP